MLMYGSVSGRGVFDLLQATQQHRSERWFCASHSLSCRLSVNVNRFVTSIGKLILYFAMQESHFLGLLLIHQKIDGFALIAEFPF